MTAQAIVCELTNRRNAYSYLRRDLLRQVGSPGSMWQKAYDAVAAQEHLFVAAVCQSGRAVIELDHLFENQWMFSVFWEVTTAEGNESRILF